MSQQIQFLNVVDSDKAKTRFEAAISLQPLGEELVDLSDALGRVLSKNVIAKVNVPSFDRSNLDGFAVKALDTVGAEEQHTVELRLINEPITAGSRPEHELPDGAAMMIATGGMMPRGADAVVMIEHADIRNEHLKVTKAVSPGTGIAFAGTDVASGEIILYQNELLTSRETGILAAIGETKVNVWRRPRVAIISTGNEIIAPGEVMSPGLIYDSNARIIADAVKELGGKPLELGVVNDDIKALKLKIVEALTQADMVLLSGGTSKGQGDLSYQVVRQFTDPGVIVHGVALKPGKPICLAATQNKPVVILPGFPTSAIFTFHEFIAPVIRQLSGLSPISQSLENAELSVRVNSEIGRTEFVLVRLLEHPEAAKNNNQPKLAAYPIGKGSGSVTTFSQADGFFSIGRHEEFVEAGTEVTVQLISRDSRPADLVIIGSHCAGLDLLMSYLKAKGIHAKFMSVGSSAGLAAVKRGQCDIAGIHLFDPDSETYNQAFIRDGLRLIKGYRRQQGLIFRKNDSRFKGENAIEMINKVKNDPSCLMINRNLGSGTRILIDQLLDGRKPNGYVVQTSNHKAVFAAIEQQRADWGVAIQAVATSENIAFIPIKDERYDFMVAESGLQKKSVQTFMSLLKDNTIKASLMAMFINIDEDAGDLF